jgi:hypothetical protein
MRCLDPSVVLKKKKGPEWFGAYLAALGEKTGSPGRLSGLQKRTWPNSSSRHTHELRAGDWVSGHRTHVCIAPRAGERARGRHRGRENEQGFRTECDATHMNLNFHRGRKVSARTQMWVFKGCLVSCLARRATPRHTRRRCGGRIGRRAAGVAAESAAAP